MPPPTPPTSHNTTLPALLHQAFCWQSKRTAMTDWGGWRVRRRGGKFELVSMLVCSLSTLYASCLAGKKKKKKEKNRTAPVTRRLRLSSFIYLFLTSVLFASSCCFFHFILKRHWEAFKVILLPHPALLWSFSFKQQQKHPFGRRLFAWCLHYVAVVLPLVCFKVCTWSVNSDLFKFYWECVWKFCFVYSLCSSVDIVATKFQTVLLGFKTLSDCFWFVRYFILKSSQALFRNMSTKKLEDEEPALFVL